MATKAKNPEPKAPAARKRAAKKAAPRDPTGDDILGEDYDEDDDDAQAPEDHRPVSVRPSARMTTAERKKAELDAAKRVKEGLPLYPYPASLAEKLYPYWLDLVNSKPVGFFNDGDVQLMKMYCRVCSDVDLLTEQIDEEGDVIYNARGNPVINPKVVARGFAEARMMTLVTKLLNQPASRAVAKDKDGLHSKRKQDAQNAVGSMEDGSDDGDDSLLAGGGVH